MLKPPAAIGLLSLPLVGLVLTSALLPPPPRPFEFERAALILETNATDGDGEIVLDLKSAVDIARLELEGARGCDDDDDDDDDDDGQKVLSIRSNKDSGLGLSQILIETGEPSLDAVLDAFPEGTYELSGRTSDGKRFKATLELSHSLLAPPEIVFPADDDEDIPVSGLVIQWILDPEAVGYVVEVEQDDLGVKVLANLPAGTSSFAVPNGFLSSGIEYDFGVRAVKQNGNVTVTEASFTTQ